MIASAALNIERCRSAATWPQLSLHLLRWQCLIVADTSATRWLAHHNRKQYSQAHRTAIADCKRPAANNLARWPDHWMQHRPVVRTLRPRKLADYKKLLARPELHQRRLELPRWLLWKRR